MNEPHRTMVVDNRHGLPMSDARSSIYNAGASVRLPKFIRFLIEKPLVPVGFCVLSAVAMLAMSYQLSLACLSLSYIFIAYYIDRRHVDALVIPPLVIFAQANFFNSSLGPLLASDEMMTKTFDSMLLTHI